MSTLIKPTNTLKEKVGDGGFDEADIEKAQKAIEDNEVDFRPIAREFLAGLDAVISSIQMGDVKAVNSLGSILDPLMQLRAQGSLFHYPSITELSDVVVDFLDTEERMDYDIVEIVNAYKAAANAIISLEIKDDKDKTCMALLDELQKACLRYQKNNDN